MIPALRPTMDEQTEKELLECYRSGWWGYGGKVLEFQEQFAEYVGAKYAVATNSATSALDLCLKAYGITDGELITTPFTFVSDAIVGEWNGMDVTFCDIDPITHNLASESLKITPQTKAIIAVDVHGRLADIDGIRAVLKAEGREDILIIEDAAHAMYTPGAGKGDITVWSFQAVKTLPIGDGGMITTNNEEIAKKVKRLSWLGIEKFTFDRVSQSGYSWDYDITHSGIKAYMTDPQAGKGMGQLRRLKDMNKRRREIQAFYNETFDSIDGFVAPAYSYTVQYYTPQWKDRDGLHKFLGEAGIDTGVHFKPLHELTYWGKAAKHPLPNCEVWRNLLSLPVHSALTNDEMNYIAEKVIEFHA